MQLVGESYTLQLAVCNFRCFSTLDALYLS